MQHQHRKSRLQSRNMSQVALAVSTARPSASQPGPTCSIRRDMRREARRNDNPPHGSSINSGRCHVMCKATVARPHSKSRMCAANMPCTVQHVLVLLYYLYINPPPEFEGFMIRAKLRLKKNEDGNFPPSIWLSSFRSSSPHLFFYFLPNCSLK